VPSARITDFWHYSLKVQIAAPGYVASQPIMLKAYIQRSSNWVALNPASAYVFFACSFPLRFFDFHILRQYQMTESYSYRIVCTHTQLLSVIGCGGDFGYAESGG